jgi:hypothetical protein
MDNSKLLLLSTAALFWYATGASWLLQYVAYPTYKRVNKTDFRMFHIFFSKFLAVSTVLPMVIGVLCSFILAFYHPESAPVGLVYLVSICAVFIVFNTLKYEIRHHNNLLNGVKDVESVDALIKSNLKQTVSWTIGSLALAYMIFKSMA